METWGQICVLSSREAGGCVATWLSWAHLLSTVTAGEEKHLSGLPCSVHPSLLPKPCGMCVSHKYSLCKALMKEENLTVALLWDVAFELAYNGTMLSWNKETSLLRQWNHRQQLKPSSVAPDLCPGGCFQYLWPNNALTTPPSNKYTWGLTYGYLYTHNSEKLVEGMDNTEGCFLKKIL